MYQIALAIIAAISAGAGAYFAARHIWRRLRENEVLKYEFITIVAHKFRTPLTQTKWLAESLLAAETDPFKRQSLEELAKANQRLIGLTGTLLEITDTEDASRSSYSFENVSLCDFARAAADEVKANFKEKNIFLSFKCDESPIAVSVDKPRMEFVIHSLLENACNYTPPGRDVEMLVGRDKGRAFVSVVDHGIGIAPLDMLRIFGKFYRADKARLIDTEGFGIGLYLARSIVRRHGGDIEAFSDGEGKGAAFTVLLPMAR